MRNLLLALWLCAAGALPAWAQARDTADFAAFREGDAVRVTVWQYPDLSGLFDIDDNGAVLHPIYREIRIAGLSQEQARAAFSGVLQRFETEPQFVIEPLYRVMVGGEVRTPNMYTFTPQTTILQAVAQAGGPTPLANLRRVRLIRLGQQTVVDLSQHEAPETQLRLRSGDQLIVDTRRNFWSHRVQPALALVGSIASMAYLTLRLTGSL